ncbi:hypothetical protein [Actinoplanes sp. NPDC049599]|jgi:hypothetical protein|uniref:hypothetical protein n=1 Tax=Actinoplanes sp. NPDC049599 TaxID=3363903 RepID=UPI00378C46A0
MGQLVPWLIFIATLATILGALARLAARTRRRGVGLEVMGPVDLVYRPHTYEINQEIRRQEQAAVEISDSGQPKR